MTVFDSGKYGNTFSSFWTIAHHSDHGLHPIIFQKGVAPFIQPPRQTTICIMHVLEVQAAPVTGMDCI